MKTFALTPADAWFFRDGRPYSEKEDNQADVESVFPPPARTLSGALRAALARANGWSGRGAWPEKLNRVLGSGPDELGALQFSGPFLIRNDEPHWPMPLHVTGTVNDDETAWTPRAFLRPAESAVACDSGSQRLPEIALAPEQRTGLKTAENLWLSARGLAAVMAGTLPPAGAVVRTKDLWTREARVGLVRNEETRATEEGALYSPSYVRLRRGAALGFGVAGVPEEMAGVPECFPLGGESRLACCEAWKGDALPVPPPRPAFVPDAEGQIAFTVALITPGRFASGALELPGATVLSACVGKALFIGGWDSLRREPLPLEPFAAAGSVWFCTASAADFDSIFTGHGQRLGAHTAHGFGQIVIGLWPPPFTKQK